MIQIKTLEISGIYPAMHGMRNPKDSWHLEDTVRDANLDAGAMIGKNDYRLAMQLAHGGPVHAKYRRMITVYADITAPMYWWAEFDTYKVGTVRNSCSKMHRLLAKPFEMSDFSFDKLPGFRNEVKQFRPEVDEEKEIWRDCKIDCSYQASDYGRIRHNGRILSCSLHQDGYIFVTIRGKQYPAHRIVAECFLDNPENKPEINHKDGNKQNNQVGNLEWVTRSENMKHAVENQLQPNSTRKYTGKFTAEERNEIKALWNSGESKRSLSKKYGVSHTCICDIVNDKYKYANQVNLYEEVATPIVDMLNELRDSYLSCNDQDTQKQIWYSILQLLPESYNQRSTIKLNYEVLAGICRSRRNHKLDEWHEFVLWAESLPYAELFLAKQEDMEN